MLAGGPGGGGVCGRRRGAQIMQRRWAAWRQNGKRMLWRLNETKRSTPNVVTLRLSPQLPLRRWPPLPELPTADVAVNVTVWLALVMYGVT